MAETFEGTLKQEGSGTLLEVPFDVRAAFGKARAPVRGTVNGHPFRTTVAVYGGRYFLGFRREIREAAGFGDGDRLSVVLELDDEPRTGASTPSGCPEPSAMRLAAPEWSAQPRCCATA